MELNRIQPCPACHGEMEIEEEMRGQTVVCPHCHRAISLQDQAGQDLSRQDELNALRIGKVAQAKRATMRVASYAMAGGMACGVGAIDMLWRAVGEYRLGDRWGMVGYVLAYDGFGLAGLWLWTKARRLGRLGRRSELSAPSELPDFSTLGDGSQVVKNLENIK